MQSESVTKRALGSYIQNQPGTSSSTDSNNNPKHCRQCCWVTLFSGLDHTGALSILSSERGTRPCSPTTLGWSKGEKSPAATEERQWSETVPGSSLQFPQSQQPEAFYAGCRWLSKVMSKAFHRSLGGWPRGICSSFYSRAKVKEGFSPARGLTSPEPSTCML